MSFLKKILPQKTYLTLTQLYSKVVPFWFIKLVDKTAPANKRYRFILELAQKNNIKTFIETGTYLGDTTNALSGHFDHIYTFEITEELVEMARKRFADRKHVEIVHGDSGEKLAGILTKVHEKAIFWLDGHYSEGFQHAKKYNLDTPIITEIKTIFESGIKDLDNVILIDDAFEFDGTRGYPTIEELRKLVSGYNKKYEVYVKYNIVFVLPNKR